MGRFVPLRRRASAFVQSAMARTADYSPNYTGYSTLNGFTAEGDATVTGGTTLTLRAAGGKVVFTGVQRWRGAGGAASTFYARLVVDGVTLAAQSKSDTSSSTTPFTFEWTMPASVVPGSTAYVQVSNSNAWWNAQNFRLLHTA